MFTASGQGERLYKGLPGIWLFTAEVRHPSSKRFGGLIKALNRERLGSSPQGWSSGKKWTPALSQGLNGKRGLQWCEVEAFAPQSRELCRQKHPQRHRGLWGQGQRMSRRSEPSPTNTTSISEAEEWLNWSRGWDQWGVSQAQVSDIVGTRNR